MEDFIAWPIWIAIYLFLGGVSAGAFVVAALSDLFGGEKYRSLARIASYLAPVPILIGLLCLVFDLGLPFSFWKLLIYPNITSVLSVGTFLLSVFSPITIIYAYLLFSQRNNPYKQPEGLQMVLAWAGIVLSIGVAAYTALLLQSVSVNAVWATSMLWLLFVISAFSTGIALTLLVTYFVADDAKEAMHFWTRFDAYLISSELVVIVLMIVGWSLTTGGPGGGQVALQNLVLGGYAPIFWIGVILFGLLVPLLLEYKELKGAGGPMLTVVASVLILVGGYLLRHVILYAGQMA